MNTIADTAKVKRKAVYAQMQAHKHTHKHTQTHGPSTLTRTLPLLSHPIPSCLDCWSEGENIPFHPTKMCIFRPAQDVSPFVCVHLIQKCKSACVCVFVCEWEREKERERKTEKESLYMNWLKTVVDCMWSGAPVLSDSTFCVFCSPSCYSVVLSEVHTVHLCQQYKSFSS